MITASSVFTTERTLPGNRELVASVTCTVHTLGKVPFVS